MLAPGGKSQIAMKFNCTGPHEMQANQSRRGQSNVENAHERRRRTLNQNLSLSNNRREKTKGAWKKSQAPLGLNQNVRYLRDHLLLDKCVD